MSKFKLICEDEAIPFGGASKIIQEFETDDLVFILGNMSNFLRKSGYLDGGKYLTTERDVNLDISEDLDEFTKNLFGKNYENETFVVNNVNMSDTIGLADGYTVNINKNKE
jgi:hypothetical protein